MVQTVHALVSESSTALQMMQKLHKKKGIPIHEMQLWYNNRQLEEDLPLSFYGITHSSSLTLKTFTRTGDCECADCKRLKEKVMLTVTWLCKSIQVECTLGEPVENLKNAIRKMEGIAVAKQKLTYKNQTLEDHKLLVSYNFGDEESGNTESPVVHMFVDSGTPTVLDKLRSMVSFKGTKTSSEPPAPTAA